MCHHKSNSSRSMNTVRSPRMEGGDVKLPLFNGNMNEDTELYWFLCETVWNMKQVQDEDIKKGQLATNFLGRTSANRASTEDTSAK